MATKKPTYHVVCERDESGWWVGRVREVRGCHTQGRTINETLRRIREALTLFVDDARRARIVEHVRLPAAARAVVSQYGQARARAEDEQRRARQAARKAVHALGGRRLRLSVRDAGHLLGLSHQRVQQLLEAIPGIAPPRRAAARRG